MKLAEKQLSSSMEDYLEAIASLKKEKGVAKVNDIGKLLKVKNSSVNSALMTLARVKLVIHEKYGTVDLTTGGERIAADVQKRHDVLFKFLSEILKIDYKVAQEDACKMEHALSQVTFERLIKFIEYVERCPKFKRQARDRKKKPV